MKAEITVQDFRGIHAKNMEKTRSRIIQGGSWKKQRIVVVIPAADTIPAKVALSLWDLIFPPNNNVARLLALGMEVGEAYSATIEQVMEHPELSKWEYMLTVEHDNLPPADGVLQLLKRMEAHPEYSCIGGLYFTKGEGGVPQVWGDPNDPVLNFRPQPPVQGELVECCGTGMGFNLWRLKIFKDPRLQKPWFKTLASKDEGLGTQDLRFWADARKYGYRCAVDCACLVGHMDSNGMVW